MKAKYLIVLMFGFILSINALAVKGPKLLYPIDNQTINKLDPVFSWKFQEKTNILFEIKIADDQGFSQNVREFSTSRFSFRCNVPYLRPGKAYFWTVRAVYPDLSGKIIKTEWSHKRSKKSVSYHFIVASGSSGFTGFQPTILSPLSGIKLTTLKTVFKWDFPDYKKANFKVKNKFGVWVSPEFKDIIYNLAISTSPGFDTDVKTFKISNNIQSLDFTIPYLQVGIDYFWRVKAIYKDPISSEITESSWSFKPKVKSQPVSFKIDKSAEDLFTFNEGMKEELFDEYDLTSVESITTGSNNCFYPAVSMNGQHLSFVSDRLGQYELFVKDLGERMGGGETRKTTSHSNKMNFSPFWLSNDKEVGFYSNRYNDEAFHLFNTNRGTGVTLLSIGLDMFEDPENFNLFGSCSTDGRVVFTVKFKNSEMYILYLLDLNDNSMTQLRPGMFPDIRDDDRIVFSSNETGNHEIWMVELEGRSVFRPTILTSHRAADFDPVLSPDGSKIAFASNRSGNTDIWVMATDGTNLRQVTYHPMVDRRPQWVDEQTFIFQSNRSVDEDGNPVNNIFKLRIDR